MTDRPATVAELPGSDLRVHADEPFTQVNELLKTDPTYSGALVVDGDELVGVVTRQQFADVIAQPFGISLFGESPISKLLKCQAIEPLRLSAETSVDQAIQQCLARRSETRYEPVLVLDDGATRLVSVHEMLLVQSDNLRCFNAEIEEQRRIAAAANEAKSRFLANMSHEIRTPLTAILGFTDLLMEEAAEGDANQKQMLDWLSTIHRNGTHLLSVLNDILDFSKIEAGKLTLERAPCSPLEVASDVVGLMRERCDSKGISIRLECASNVPRAIFSDATRLKQVLLNLASNAVKFTSIGQIHVAIRLELRNGEEFLLFSVTDTGIGMTEEQQRQVFQPFSQADVSTTRKYGGTGLGLTISRQLAQLMGGDLSLESERGAGTTLTLQIPAAKARLERERPKLTADTQLNCRLLLAEDGIDNQRLISHVLKKAGAQVTIVDNGLDALKRALKEWDANTPFDAILMDMQMPVMDGYTASASLREKGYSLPIIALTAHALSSDRNKCLNAGCDDFLTKPIQRQKLISVVSSHTTPLPA